MMARNNQKSSQILPAFTLSKKSDMRLQNKDFTAGILCLQAELAPLSELKSLHLFTFVVESL